jgi:hypothetical protein
MQEMVVRLGTITTVSKRVISGEWDARELLLGAMNRLPSNGAVNTEAGVRDSGRYDLRSIVTIEEMRAEQSLTVQPLGEADADVVSTVTLPPEDLPQVLIALSLATRGNTAEYDRLAGFR